MLEGLRLCRRHPQYKKHKTWDGDGVLVVRGNFCDLLDAEDARRYEELCHRILGQIFTCHARISCGKPSGIEVDKIDEGSEFALSGKDVLIDQIVHNWQRAKRP